MLGLLSLGYWYSVLSGMLVLCSLWDAGPWQTGAESSLNGINSGKELPLLPGSNLCPNPGADLSVEQRPQPWEQSWEKGQAQRVLIPETPQSSLDKATRLPEIPAGWVGETRAGSCGSALAQLFNDGFSQSLIISREGKKIPVGRAAKQPGNLSGRAVSAL